MANNNKFYWIKLKTDFFGREEIDYLLSQKNGAEYVVLYQMLCLNTANNYGRLERKIGEMIIPYNAEKIVRDCKYFDIDTVNIAMALYKKLGLIYEEQDGILSIADYNTMVGSESASLSAIKKREYRAKVKEKNRVVDIKVDNEADNLGTKCPIEYRDKSIETIDSITIDNKKENILDNSFHSLSNIKESEKNSSKKKFVKPTIEEIKAYCDERNNNIDAEEFYDYYESNGWKVGRNPMKDWKSTIRNWERKKKRPQSIEEKNREFFEKKMKELEMEEDE